MGEMPYPGAAADFDSFINDCRLMCLMGDVVCLMGDVGNFVNLILKDQVSVL